MNTIADSPKIFVFDVPSPDLLTETVIVYYRECQIAGAGSVEVVLEDHNTIIISATRYLPADMFVEAVVTNDVLQVLCRRGDRQPVVLREFSDWTRYSVRRANR